MGFFDVIDLVMAATDDLLFEAESAVEETWGGGDYNAGQQSLVDGYALPASLDYVDGTWPKSEENEFYAAVFSAHPGIEQSLSDMAEQVWSAIADVQYEVEALKGDILLEGDPGDAELDAAEDRGPLDDW